MLVARRDSVKRPRGTEELKPVSVDHHQYLAKMLLIYQSIRERMPFLDEVIVQQDGAGAHVGYGVPASLKAVRAVGLPHIHLRTQPAQSSGLNKLDLCLFNSMNKEAQKMNLRRAAYFCHPNVF